MKYIPPLMPAFNAGWLREMRFKVEAFSRILPIILKCQSEQKSNQSFFAALVLRKYAERPLRKISCGRGVICVVLFPFSRTDERRSSHQCSQGAGAVFLLLLNIQEHRARGVPCWLSDG